MSNPDIKRMAGLPWKESGKAVLKSIAFPGDQRDCWTFPKGTPATDTLDILVRAGGWISEPDALNDYLRLHPEFSSSPERAKQIAYNALRHQNRVFEARNIPWSVDPEVRQGEDGEVIRGFTLKRAQKQTVYPPIINATDAELKIDRMIQDRK